MNAPRDFVRGLSARGAARLLFAAACAGVPAPVYVFVVLVAPLWVHLLVMLKAGDGATVGIVGAQVVVEAGVFYGLSRLAVGGLRRLPQRARLPALVGLCIASLVPLCLQAYAICYSHCSRASVLRLLQEFSMS